MFDVIIDFLTDLNSLKFKLIVNASFRVYPHRPSPLHLTPPTMYPSHHSN